MPKIKRLLVSATLLLLLVMSIITVNGVFEDSRFATNGQVTLSDHSLPGNDVSAATGKTRAIPSSRHHHQDSCKDVCMDCSCHLYLSAQGQGVFHCPMQSIRAFAELSQYFPEVYLSRFIPPPHSLA